MNWIKENKKVVAISAAVTTAVGLGLYFLLQDDDEKDLAEFNLDQNKQNKVSGQQQQPTQQPQQAEPYSQVNKPGSMKLSEDLQNRIKEEVKKLQVVYDQQVPQYVSFQTIIQIVQVSVQVVDNDYVELVKRQRIERRAVTGEEYENLVIAQCEEVDRLLMEIQDEIIKQLGINQQTFEQSFELIIQRQQHEYFIQFAQQMKQVLKMKLQSNATENLEKALEIMRFQVDLIKQEPEFIQKALSKAQTNPLIIQNLGQIINVMLCDQIYQEKGVEEEDIIKMIGKDSMNNQELQKLFMESQEVMGNMERKLMQAQQQAMGAMGQGQGMPMF